MCIRDSFSDDLARGTTLVVSVMEHEGDGAALAAWLASDATAPQRLAAAGVAEDAARLVGDATLFLRAAAAACLRKNTSEAWVALAEAVTAGIDTDGVEAARRAVFPERVASARIDAWFAPPKRKKKRFPREISDAARAAQTVVAALAATDEAEAFARATAADLRATARAARPTTRDDRGARGATPAPRAGSRAEFEAALAREDGGGAVARFLRLTDRQLLWGQAAPAAAPAAPAPAPAPPKKKKKLRRQGCDCAATGPHRRTCPLYRPPAPKPTPTDFWAREAARRTDEVLSLIHI